VETAYSSEINDLSIVDFETALDNLLMTALLCSKRLEKVSSMIMNETVRKIK
jgi:hypothetical protein